MKRIKTQLTTIFVMAVSMLAFGQNSIELTFTANKNGQYIAMDSIYIKNLTQGDAATLYADDTVLTLLISGINHPIEIPSQNSLVLHNSPNPFDGVTSIKIFVPGTKQITLEVSSINGKRVALSKTSLNKGFHNFSFTAGPDRFYLLTVHYENITNTVKMINSGKSNHHCSLVYAGEADSQPVQKNSSLYSAMSYAIGDELLFIGYAAGVEAGFMNSPEASRLYIVQFATNVACPGIDSLLYADVWYHPIQVFGQCWLKENLNVGMMINGNVAPTNNGFIEKYCYANSEYYCSIEGGLYLWDEIMEYTTTAGARGICPSGWHIPTDNEIKVLEGAADSYYKIGAWTWNNTGFRGYDAGKNLKSTSGWEGNGNGTDLYDFGVLPTGYWYANYFSERTVDGGMWSSTLDVGSVAFYRGMTAASNKVARNSFNEPVGFSVRCLKDL